MEIKIVRTREYFNSTTVQHMIKDTTEEKKKKKVEASLKGRKGM